MTTLDPDEKHLPSIQKLILSVKSISIKTPVTDVLQLFKIYKELPAVFILDTDNNFLGLISRCTPLNQIPTQLLEPLFPAEQTLEQLIQIMPDIFLSPLTIDINEPVHQVISTVFNLNLNEKPCVFPVKKGDTLVGILRLTDLVAELFRAYCDLSKITEQAQRLTTEVQQAAGLNQYLFRSNEIDFYGVQGLVTLMSCGELSGDFYDYYQVDSRWVVMMVGDASGHGVAASIVVTIAKAITVLLEGQKEKDPSKILEHINHAIFQSVKSELLMTMFIACVDTQTGEMCYANAGHQFPYLYKAASNKLIILEDATGLPLGKKDHTHYAQRLIQTETQDRLFVYTDALIEEESPDGEPFNYHRLEEILSDHIQDNPEYLRDFLIERLTTHIERFNFNDDLTMLHVEFF